jgi:hypothetical protein
MRIGKYSSRTLALIAFGAILVMAPGSVVGQVIQGTDVLDKDQHYRFHVGLGPVSVQRGNEVVAVKRGEEFYYHHCGGTLIQPEPPQEESWVLTAAHCVINTETPDQNLILQIYVGSYDYQNGERISVESSYVHPLYDYRTGVNDLALLRLKKSPHEEIINGQKVSKVSKVKLADQKLANDALKPKADVTAVALGWGSNVPHAQHGSPILQRVPLKLIDDKECNTRATKERIIYDLVHDFKRLSRESATPLAKSISEDVAKGSSPYVTDRMICGVDETPPEIGTVLKGVCYGDSGGPLLIAIDKDGKPTDPDPDGSKFVEFRQVGVLALLVTGTAYSEFQGLEGCDVGIGIFTNIAQEPIADWISSTIKSAPKPSENMPPAPDPNSSQREPDHSTDRPVGSTR